jgi:hypothetical protein
MLSDATNAQGLREYLVVYRDARVTESGAFDLLQRLARTERRLSTRRPAQYSGLDHANHTRALCRSRAMGCATCSRISRKLVR